MRRALLLLLALAAGPAAAAPQTIRPFAPDSLARIEAAHAGQPYVVLVWSLDCAYCHASFAALALAQRRHGFAVVAIAMDRADDPQAADAMRAHLAASGLVAETWAFGPASAERLRYAIDPAWRGEMPRTYWHTPKGRGRAYSGAVTAAVMDRFL